jgi:hypothetical protein
MRRRGPQQRHVGSDRAALDYLLNHENQRRIVALDDTTLGEMVSDLPRSLDDARTACAALAGRASTSRPMNAQLAKQTPTDIIGP